MHAVFVFLCHDTDEKEKNELYALSYVKIKYDLCIFCPLRQTFLTQSPKIESYPLINHVPAVHPSSFPVSLQEREEGTVSQSVCLLTELDLCKALSH